MVSPFFGIFLLLGVCFGGSVNLSLGNNLWGQSFYCGDSSFCLVNFCTYFKTPWGCLGDKGKSFEVMMVGAIFGALAGFFYILSFVMKSLVIFAVGRALHGVAAAFFFPSSLSTAITLAPKGRVGETLGWRGTMFSVSQLLGPAVGGFVAEYLGFHSAFILTIILSLIGFFFVLNAYREIKDKMYVKEEEERKRSYKELVNLSFIFAAVSLFLMTFAYSGMYTFLPAYYKLLGFGTSVFGVYASVMGGFSILTRVFGGREADKRGPVPVALVGLLLSSISYGILVIYLLPPEAYLSAAILGMGFGLTVPALQMLALAALPKNIRGVGSSIYTMFFDLGYLSGPLALGYLAESEGYKSVFFFLPILTFLSLLNLMILRLWRRKKA